LSIALKKTVEDSNIFVWHFSRIIAGIKCENKFRGYLGICVNYLGKFKSFTNFEKQKKYFKKMVLQIFMAKLLKAVQKFFVEKGSTIVIITI